MTTHAQGKAQKRLVKTLPLHLTLILGTEAVYNNNNNKTANTGEGGI